MVIENIIRDYLDGRELTPAELEYLSAWRKEDTKNERFFLKLQSLRQDGRLLQRLGKESAATYVKVRCRAENARRRSARLLLRRISVAAVAVIVVAAAGWLLIPSRGDDPSRFAGNTMPGSSKAVLHLADGTAIEIDASSADVIETDGSVITLDGGEISYSADGDAANIAYNNISIPRSGEYKLTLSDGTQVWLNAESSLRYPQKFSGDERRVFLSGEAYFDVTENKAMPFVVETAEQTLTVLGTEFNVYAYPNEQKVLTTLLTGSVGVTANGASEQMMLVPGQQLQLDNATRLFSVKTVDVAEIGAWREGYFVIDDQTFEDVMLKLSRWYDVDFIFEDESARRLVFKGSIPKYEDLTAVLNIIQTVSPVRFNYREDAVVIRNK